MNWEKIDWAYLQRLRSLYTGAPLAASAVYFDSDEQLESYHLTLGARIGWKWDYVLGELKHRGWEFSLPEWTDWGCGSGVASLALLRNGVSPQKLSLWDHSTRAMSLAKTKVREFGPQISMELLTKAPKSASCLLLSHVLNELTAANQESLFQLVKNSEVILWVENGTHATSRELSKFRDRLLETGLFEVLAPCAQQGVCGVLASQNERHWCHTFGPVPSEAHQSPRWREVATRLSIDLRSLPLSFLVLAKKDSKCVKRTLKEDASRVFRLIGEARHYKGYSKLLTCHGQRGVSEIILQKRDAPALMKILQKASFEVPLLKVELNGEKVQSGVWI